MRVFHRRYCAALLLVGSVCAAYADELPKSAAVEVITTRALPDLKDKEVTILEVEYPPGGESPPHRHHAHTFVYVLEGTVVMQVAGAESVTLRAGQTFYESPSDVHTVSRNASRDAPAKLLVFFVKDRGVPLSTSAPEGAVHH